MKVLMYDTFAGTAFLWETAKCWNCLFTVTSLQKKRAWEPMSIKLGSVLHLFLDVLQLFVDIVCLYIVEMCLLLDVYVCVAI